MVTKNFLNILALSLQSGAKFACLPVRTVIGENRFIGGYLGGSFPGYANSTVTLSANSAGISIGTGTTPATEDDYQLEATITSGINITLTGTSYGADSPRSPYIKFDITVTNIGSETITVGEIGYKQTAKATRIVGGTLGAASSESVLLIDRTVLDTPVTIAPGDAGIVTYKIRTKTAPNPAPVAGVEIASFSFGTDAQIAAILDAAAAGTIDLQRDAGWKVGDQRDITIGAFAAGGSVAIPEQEIAIVITSFDEYMGCGNVLQFDFACGITGKVRMNALSNTNGGYKESEMRTVTLPALVNALPDWLKTRLKTFSVLAGSGGAVASSQTIETVTGNKLALRSEIELFGDNSRSPAGEGSAIAYYAGNVHNRKTLEKFDGGLSQWWTRSVTGPSYFGSVYDGTSSYAAANTQYTVIPFGCV